MVVGEGAEAHRLARAAAATEGLERLGLGKLGDACVEWDDGHDGFLFRRARTLAVEPVKQRGGGCVLVAWEAEG